MVKKRVPMTQLQRTQAIEELQREVARRNAGYRARALSLFPHLCASCAREFSGMRLKELTVHHKDHNHDNNPPDGSNWELLCVFCHDHEHEKMLDAKHIRAGSTSVKPEKSGFSNPFEQLESLVEKDQQEE